MGFVMGVRDISEGFSQVLGQKNETHAVTTSLGFGEQRLGCRPSPLCETTHPERSSRWS